MGRWTGSPQYLKHLQKIRSMSPEKRAVTQGLIDELGGIYAGADMQKQLQSMRSAATGEEQERSLGLRQERLDANQDLGERRLHLKDRTVDYAKDQNRTAEILGYGNIGLSGLTGYADMKHKKKMTGLFEKMLKNY